MRWAAAEWRVAARLARREVRRHPWRSALVIAMVGLPVAGVTFAAVGARTHSVTPAEERTMHLGRADDVVSHDGNRNEPRMQPATHAAVLETAYPEGSRFVQVELGQDAVFDPDAHLQSVTATDHPLDEPLLEGAIAVTEGRAPRLENEVAVTRNVLDIADAGIGDEIDLFLAGRATVTGVVADAGCPSCRLVVGTETPKHVYVERRVFVDAPAGLVAPLTPISGLGYSWMMQNREDTESTEARALLVIYLWGTVALAGVAIVVSAAFAVAARRQVRMLGLLSASGAAPADLRRIVMLQGVTAGVVGSAFGVVAGVAAAWAAPGLLENFGQGYSGDLQIHPLDLAVPFGLGLLAATISAWRPARTAARVPVLTALAGHRPLDMHAPVAVPVVAIVLVLAGIAVLNVYAQSPEAAGPLLGIGAILAVLLGPRAIVTWVVSKLESLSGRLQGGARLAVRDLARQRYRTVAVVTAVMIPAGLSVFSATNAVTGEARETPLPGFEEDASVPEEMKHHALAIAPTGSTLEEFQDELDRVRSVLPDATESDVEGAFPPDATGVTDIATLRIVDPVGPQPEQTRFVIVNQPEQMEGTSAPPAFIEALRAGKVVLPGEAPVEGALVTLTGTAATITTDDIVAFDLDVPRADEIVLVSPETATRWGLRRHYYGTLFRNPEPLSAEQRDRLVRVLDACYETGTPDSSPECMDRRIQDQLLAQSTVGGIGSVQVYPSPSITDPSPNDDPLELQLVLAGGCLAFTLLVVTVALALTSAEGRDDRALLAAIGAPPRVRQSVLAWQAGMLPALAMLFAVPGALAVAFATLDSRDFTQQNTSVGVQVPWLALGLLALGIPAVSAGLAWLGANLTGWRHQDLSSAALAAD